MSHYKRLSILSMLVAVFALPVAANASPRLRLVAKAAVQTKHFIQLKPGMQRAAFESRSGLDKKQLIASLRLARTKERPR